jgi:hypothetical protein
VTAASGRRRTSENVSLENSGVAKERSARATTQVVGIAGTCETSELDWVKSICPNSSGVAYVILHNQASS